MPRLILIHPEFANQFCDLPDGTWSLGRSRDSQIVIQHDSVSGHHCDLLVWGTEVIVREHGSRNGTFVDGIRVKAQSGVRHGQYLRFGSVEARIEIPASLLDDATSGTALHSYRRLRNQDKQAPASFTTFPVVFAPNAAKQDSAGS